MATLFWTQLKLRQSFSYGKIPFSLATLLIRPDLPGPLVAGLTGFHCTRKVRCVLPQRVCIFSHSGLKN